MNKKSKSKFFHLTKKVTVDKKRQPMNQDIYIGECLVSFYNGRLFDISGEPAVQCENGHFEHWRNGLLHRTDGPAIVSEWGKHMEFWEKGRRLK